MDLMPKPSFLRVILMCLARALGILVALLAGVIFESTSTNDSPVMNKDSDLAIDT